MATTFWVYGLGVSGSESVGSAVAANIRTIREDRGMTQGHLASLMTANGQKWHQATVHKVESGGRQVTIDEAEALSRIFQIDLAALTARPAEARAVAAVAQRLLDLDTARFAFQRAYSDWHMRQLILRFTVTDPSRDRDDEGWQRPAIEENHGVRYLPGILESFSNDRIDRIGRAITETPQAIIDELSGPPPLFDVNDTTT